MDDIMKIGQAADFLGLTADRLRRLEGSDGPAFWRTPGGDRRYSRRVLSEFKARQAGDISPSRRGAITALAMLSNCLDVSPHDVNLLAARELIAAYLEATR